MHAKLKFAAWLVALYGSLLASAAAAVFLVGREIPAAGLVFVAAALLAACGGLVAWMLKRYATAPRALAEQTRLVLANPGYRVQAGTAGTPPPPAGGQPPPRPPHRGRGGVGGEIPQTRSRPPGGGQ